MMSSDVCSMYIYVQKTVLFMLTSPLAALDETSILDICRDETSIFDICKVVLKSRGWMTSGPLALAWATDSNLHFRQAASVTFVC